MTEKKRLLQTANMDFSKKEIPPRPSWPIISTNKPEMSPIDFLARYATKEELEGLRDLVKKRLANRPRNTFWICKGCGFRHMGSPEAVEPLNCLRCNWQGLESSGGWCRPMTAPEIKQFQVDSKRAFGRAVEQTRKAAFNAENETRLKLGLDALTFEQWTNHEQEKHRTQQQREEQIRQAAIK